MIRQINSLIQKLGIDTATVTASTQIGEKGIGFDSQELVELSCMMEKHFKVNLPRKFLCKDNTIADIAASLEKLKEASMHDCPFEGHCEATLVIACPVEKAYQAIYQMEKWPENLPHVKRIETLYNDGVYQEFLMDVHSDSGLIKVRSIRRCTSNDSITFFQPNPPAFLKHHCGGWKFIPFGNECKVTTWHQWNLHPSKATEIFPSQDGKTTKQRVENTLLSHAELALQTWKKVLEAHS
jgi:acyl carrier protein